MQDPATEPHDAYYDALRKAGAQLDEGLAVIRGKENAGELGPFQSADERIGLLGRHLGMLAELRAGHDRYLS